MNKAHTEKRKHSDPESLMLSTDAGMTGVWFGRLDMLRNLFGWAEYIGCAPNVIVGSATAHPAP